MALKIKKGVDDLTGIEGKRVLLRVDFNVPIKDGVIQNDFRVRETLPTIKKLTEQGARVIILSHMGRPSGVPMGVDSSKQDHVEAVMRTWLAEKATGKTDYFAHLPPKDKAWILRNVAKDKLPKEWGGNVPEEAGSGKVKFFAGFDEAGKSDLLNKWTAEHEQERTDFQFLRKYHGYEDENTLAPVLPLLSELLGHPVTFAPDCLCALPQVEELRNGGVLLLENVRFYKNENAKKEADRAEMAAVLASYGDCFVCDAFGTAHRDAASITGIPKILGHGYAGYLMKKEIDAFAAALSKPEHPMAAIVGGSKVSDKIKVLENLLARVDKLFIGGAMAYAFLKAKGFKIGKSFCEKGQSFRDKYGEEHDSILDLAQGLIDKCKAQNVELFLPVDHVTHTEIKDTDSPNVTSDENVPDDHLALDIGPKTRKLYVDAIKKCKTVIWNGPMGVFEIKAFAEGTFDIVKALGECDGLTIIGGGDSAAAAEKSGYADKIKHISTGGGASLELMEGKDLPGIAVLDDA
ncbi:Phosphoglycerate kinase [Diplonema papillatum]|nr:Phosphoglycerate kinase [Diplonema papillatum]